MQLKMVGVSWLVAGLIVACGGKSTETDSPRETPGAGGDKSDAVATAGAGAEAGVEQSEPIALDDLPAAYAAALCAGIDSCGNVPNDLWSVTPGEDCAAKTQTAFEEDLPGLSSSIEAGRITYQPKMLRACLDAITAGGCEALSGRWPSLCKAAFEGHVEAGASCERDFDCAGDAYCKAAESCPGTCTPREPAGADCARDTDCAAGLICYAQTGVCGAPAQEHEPCDTGVARCEPGMWCVTTAEREQPECVKVDDLFVGNEGDACSATIGFCRGDLRCDQQLDRCVKELPKDAPCNGSLPDACPDDQYCDTLQEQRCVPKLDVGESCHDSTFCLPGLRCDEHVCAPIAHLGEACHSDFSCYSQRCVDDVCVSADACP